MGTGQFKTALVYALLFGGLTATGAAAIQDSPATQPARGVVRPYNLLDDLSAEQTEQLRTIRGDYLAKMAEIREEERERSMAVLTPEQRERLEVIDAERRAEAAKRRAERREAEDDDEESGD